MRPRIRYLVMKSHSQGPLLVRILEKMHEFLGYWSLVLKAKKLVRLCTVVLLCNLDLRKGTESYFFAGKKQATALKYLPLIFHQNRQKQNRAKCTNDDPELGLLDFIGFLRGPPV